MNKKEPTDKNLLIFFDDIEKVNNNSIYEVYSGRDGLTVIFNVNSDYDKFQVNKDLNNLLDKNFTKIPEIVDKGVKNKLYKILLNTNLSYTAHTPRQEEEGSVWILNKAIANRERVKFSTVSDIKNNKDYNELEDIFGGKVPQDWLESYLKQQKKILEVYGDQKWQEFKYSGSGSFRQYIENKIRRLINFGFDSDRNYNPYGNNYKMNEITAAAILTFLEDNFKKILNHSRKMLKMSRDINCPQLYSFSNHIYPMCICFLNNNFDQEYLVKINKKVECKKYYKPLLKLKNSVELYNKILCYPIHSDIKEFVFV